MITISKQIGKYFFELTHNPETGDTTISCKWDNLNWGLTETTFIPRYTIYRAIGELTMEKHHCAKDLAEFGIYALVKLYE